MLDGPLRIQQSNDFRVIRRASHLSVQVLSGDLVMMVVVRRGTVRSYDDVEVSLVRVDDRRPDACVRVNTRHNECHRLKRKESRLNFCSEEGTVSFLDDDWLTFAAFQVGKELASLGPSDGNPDAVPPHFEETIAQIGREFASNHVTGWWWVRKALAS
jgi:hypothetical protein